MTATKAPPISGKWLDVLSWVQAGQVRSTWPGDGAPVRFHRTELSSRCITTVFRPIVEAGLVERLDGGVQWKLTGAGLAALDAATVHVVVDENAITDRAGRRGADWWHDYYRTSPDAMRAADGTIWVPCAGVGAARRWMDLMVANGVPKTALRIQEAS